MDKRFKKYKGIHPGIVLERELEKRELSQRPFAISLGEHPQSFNAIIKGRRRLNTALALKVEDALDLQEGTLVLLQTYYDIRKEKEKQLCPPPDLSILRRSLFWDTDVDRLEWHLQYKAVIQRVFERGNEEEKQEIIRFYGRTKVKSALRDLEARKGVDLHQEIR